MRPYVAGVDTSTQSCKVIIWDPASGQIVREGKASHPDGTEVHPDHWWAAFEQALDAAGGLDDVHALSVGGQQHGMVCLDADGQVIRPALLWNDTRSAQAAVDLIEECGTATQEGADALPSDGESQHPEELVTAHDAGKRWWVEATGSVPVASFTVTKLRWLADNEPENAARIAAICLPHDWLTWKISGSTDLADLRTDRSDASGTGYVATDGRTYRYDILARALRIDEDAARRIILPRICEPWEVAGRGDAARGWGEILLGPGCGDNAGAALGVDLRPGQALLSLGTSGVISAVASQPVCDPDGLVTGFSDASGNWLPLACTLNASRIIDAMCKVTGLDYDAFDDAALSVPDARGLVLVPYFEGERTPNLPHATATLSGMTLANSAPEYVARATVEGLLSLMRFALDAVRNLGAPIDEVILVGGGARSRAVQSLAEGMLGARVRVAPSAEYVALGAARQAAEVARRVE